MKRVGCWQMQKRPISYLLSLPRRLALPCKLLSTASGRRSPPTMASFRWIGMLPGSFDGSTSRSPTRCPGHRAISRALDAQIKP